MKNESKKWLWWFAASFAVAGLIDSQLPITDAFFSGSAVVHMIVIGFLTFGWVKAHSRETGVALPSGSALFAGAIPLVGVPVYFFRTRGAKLGGISTLKAVGFFLVCGLAYEATFYLGTLGNVARGS
jgi:hypothetical protein